MSEQEIKHWLGFGPEADDLQLQPEIVQGMKDCSVPSTDDEQVTVFGTFLRCVGTRSGRGMVFVPETES